MVPLLRYIELDVYKQMTIPSRFMEIPESCVAESMDAAKDLPGKSFYARVGTGAIYTLAIYVKNGNSAYI